MHFIRHYEYLGHTIQLMEHEDIMAECMLGYEYIYNLCLCRMHLYYSEILLMELSYRSQIRLYAIRHRHNISVDYTSTAQYIHRHHWLM